MCRNGLRIFSWRGRISAGKDKLGLMMMDGEACLKSEVGIAVELKLLDPQFKKRNSQCYVILSATFFRRKMKVGVVA